MVIVVFRHIEISLTRAEKKRCGARGDTVYALLPQNVSSRKPRLVNKREMNVVKPFLKHFQVNERKNYSDNDRENDDRRRPFSSPETARDKKSDDKERKETELGAPTAENRYGHKGEDRNKDVEMNEFSAYFVDVYQGHQIGIHHQGDNAHDV